ncbi:MAG: hypothetical protein ACRD0P_25425, partial [Stackebrandtia sp.]
MDTNAALRIARQNFRHLGIQMPTELGKELGDIRATLLRAPKFAHDETALPAAVWNAVAAGRDPFTDKNVVAQLHADLLTKEHLGARLPQHADALEAVALHRHAPAILATLSDTVTTADELIADAHDKIPGFDIANPSGAAMLPPQYATTWANARSATASLAMVAATWTAVVGGAGLVRTLPV